MGQYEIDDAKKVMRMIKAGKYNIGSKEIDISDMMEQTTSQVYRAADIKKPDMTKSEHDCTCTYQIKSYGTVDALFDNIRNGKVAILNFASSKNPGGAFMDGAKTQEENICHHSNLYTELTKYMDFYEYNRENQKKSLYSDGIIYSNNIVFFRRNFNNVKPVFGDVITCAAPNRGAALGKWVKEEAIEQTMTRRLEQIFNVAVEHSVEVLVLGAFGCGVFRNKVEFVASEMYRLLEDEGYNKMFKIVVFPLCEVKGKNTDTFKSIFKL